jgi:hypothetical protein
MAAESLPSNGHVCSRFLATDLCGGYIILTFSTHDSTNSEGNESIGNETGDGLKNVVIEHVLTITFAICLYYAQESDTNLIKVNSLFSK